MLSLNLLNSVTKIFVIKWACTIPVYEISKARARDRIFKSSPILASVILSDSLNSPNSLEAMKVLPH